MVQVQVETVRDLQHAVDDASLTIAFRSLSVRRFCNEHKPSGPVGDRSKGNQLVWPTVDTDYLLTISSNMSLLSNYLVERVVAAS